MSIKVVYDGSCFRLAPSTYPRILNKALLALLGVNHRSYRVPHVEARFPARLFGSQNARNVLGFVDPRPLM